LTKIAKKCLLTNLHLHSGLFKLIYVNIKVKGNKAETFPKVDFMLLNIFTIKRRNLIKIPSSNMRRRLANDDLRSCAISGEVFFNAHLNLLVFD
jgi:hypothetical protein